MLTLSWQEVRDSDTCCGLMLRASSQLGPLHILHIMINLFLYTQPSAEEFGSLSFTLHEKLTPTLVKFRVPDHNNLLHCRETLNFTSQIDVQWNVLETSMSVPFQERSFLSIFSPLVGILNIDTNSHLRLSHLARFLCKATYNQCYSTRRAAVIIITESSH